MATNQKAHRVLSCDAGGMRGIFSLCFLEHFEQETGRKCHEMFDLFAGTSTGAIIAGGLSSGMSAKEILEFYLQHGEQIFSERMQKWYLPWTFLTKPKYSLKPLERMLHDMFGDKNIFAHDFPKRLMIFAKDLTTSKNVYFNNNDTYKPDEYQAYISNPDVWDRYGTLYKVMCASSAAPIYFPAYTKFLDGGVGVHGNPIYQAALEAVFYYRWEHVEIYSVGTGIFSNTMKEGDATKKHLLDWASYVVDELMQDANEQQTDVTEQMLNRLATTKLRRYNIDFTRLEHNGTLSAEKVRTFSKMDAAKHAEAFAEIGRQMAGETSFFSDIAHNRVPLA